MTDSQKVEALQSLLNRVIHAYELTVFEIDDCIVASDVQKKADVFFDEMLTILHSNA